MKTNDIIKAIYTYYPRNLDWDNSESVTASKEYLNRLKKCEEARLNKKIWDDFKEDINNYTQYNFSTKIRDYSILGSVPCFHVSIRFNFNETNNARIISIFICVIIPLWSYRIIDLEQEESIRYKFIGSDEENLIIQLRSFILDYFPNFEFIDENQHQTIISDIATAYKISPTIFEAIFTDVEN